MPRRMSPLSVDASHLGHNGRSPLGAETLVLQEPVDPGPTGPYPRGHLACQLVRCEAATASRGVARGTLSTRLNQGFQLLSIP